jgi:hypothetical protein
MPAPMPVFWRAPLTRGVLSMVDIATSLSGSFGNTMGTVVITTMCFMLWGSAAILERMLNKSAPIPMTVNIIWQPL